jgi:hypothetical protein
MGLKRRWRRLGRRKGEVDGHRHLAVQLLFLSFKEKRGEEMKMVNMTEAAMRKLLKGQVCCGKVMKINEFYSQGTETVTALCNECGNYVSIETGELDEEFLDKDQKAVL